MSPIKHNASYGQSRVPEIHLTYDRFWAQCTVRALIGDQGFAFEDAQVIWSALRDYEGAKTIRGKPLDFAEALIARKSGYVAQTKGTKFNGLFSFDKALAQLSGTKPMSV